jgi:hypothetical protein
MKMKKYISTLYLVVIFLTLSTGCEPRAQTAIPLTTDLTVSMLYPVETTEVELGQSIKSIVRVLNHEGEAVGNAGVTLWFKDPAGQLMATIPAMFGDGDVYRTETWTIPHRLQEGNWTLIVEAKTDTQRGMLTTTFRVKNSTSEILLYKYGFWVDSPALRGVVPNLVKEQGDAQNGVITWGGVVPSQHIFPESWLEVHWREGDFNLQTENDVREFMLTELGQMGFSPMRELGPFEQANFKHWDAWQVKSRGELLRYDEQWMIFYALEADKTYAILTTVVQPPAGIDAHAYLRDGFAVHPEVAAHGEAPQPLPRLLPPPELVSPKLGTRILGTSQPILLVWKPVKELAEDEYYLVSIDYNYVEANLVVEYTTRETQFTLPDSLYHLPNCGVFNWQITLMQQTGVREDGRLKGEPISFRSLYWYIEWRYPLGEDAPFDPLCPNAQF